MLLLAIQFRQDKAGISSVRDEGERGGYWCPKFKYTLSCTHLPPTSLTVLSFQRNNGAL